MQTPDPPSGSVEWSDLTPWILRASPLFYDWSDPLAAYTAEWEILPFLIYGGWRSLPLDATGLFEGNKTVAARDAVNGWPAITAVCSAAFDAYRTKTAAGTVIYTGTGTRYERTSNRTETRDIEVNTDPGDEGFDTTNEASGTTDLESGPGDCAGWTDDPPDTTTSTASGFPSGFPDLADRWQYRSEGHNLCSGSLTVTLTSPTDADYWSALDAAYHAQDESWKAEAASESGYPVSRTESHGINAKSTVGEFYLRAVSWPASWFLNSRQPSVDYSARNTDGSTSIRAELVTRALLPLAYQADTGTPIEADSLIANGTASVTLSDEITEKYRDDFGNLDDDPTEEALWSTAPTWILPACQVGTDPEPFDAFYARGRWRSRDGKKYRITLRWTAGLAGVPENPPAGTDVVLTMTDASGVWETSWFDARDIPADTGTLAYITAERWSETESEWKTVNVWITAEREPPGDPIDPPEEAPALEADLVSTSPCDRRPLLYTEQRRELWLWGHPGFTEPDTRYATATIAVDIDAAGTPDPACSCGSAPAGNITITGTVEWSPLDGRPTSTLGTATANLLGRSFDPLITAPEDRTGDWVEYEAIQYAAGVESDTLLQSTPADTFDECFAAFYDSAAFCYDDDDPAETVTEVLDDRDPEADPPSTYIYTPFVDPGAIAPGHLYQLRNLAVEPT